MGNEGFLSNRTYFILFFLLGIVYVTGLFVPLMDKDAPHYANIALHMHLTGDYAKLIDFQGAYLDKPHLLFWLAAFSYKIFGVSAFAYKLPSFLFSILGIWSVYRLGKILYDKETGRLSALILCASFAFILANNDVRMDAILTSCVAFACWQLVVFVQTHKLWAAAGAALGMALGFSVKGHIGVLTPLVAIAFYILYLKKWRILLNPGWLLMLVLFVVFIIPVVYSYYLQYNLHPEVAVRGKQEINGVRFILFSQSIERFRGDMGLKLNRDYTFLLHSFIWAFAPWSIIAYMALVGRLKNFFRRREEWLTAGCFVIMLLVFSLSGYKLPHYVNIVFPFASIMAASFLLAMADKPRWINSVWIIQSISVIIILLVTVALNGWAFPLRNPWVMIASVLITGILYHLINRTSGKVKRSVIISTGAMILCFFLLNTNFYPRLLQYQGSRELLEKTKGSVEPRDVYSWKNSYTPSYFFLTRSTEKEFTDDVMRDRNSVWVLIDEKKLDEVRQKGYRPGIYFAATNYSIAKLKLSFLNPATRESKCGRLLLLQISREESLP